MNYEDILFKKMSETDFRVRTNMITRKIDVDPVIMSTAAQRIDSENQLCQSIFRKMQTESNKIIEFLAHSFFLRTKKPSNIAKGNMTIFEKKTYRTILSETFNVCAASLTYKGNDFIKVGNIEAFLRRTINDRTIGGPSVAIKTIMESSQM